MIAEYRLHRLTSAFGARWLLLVVIAAFSSAAWAQAGFVKSVAGKVMMQNASGKSVAGKTGDTFDSYTNLRTGPDSKVTLKFADGQIVALGANSILRIGRYRYVAANPFLGSTSLEVVKGEMRFVAGLIGVANPEAVLITAGESIVTIREAGGADFNVAVSNQGQEHGWSAVAQGEVAIRTPYGPITRIAEGQYAPWQPGRRELLGIPIAAAPAAVQAAAADMWATLLPADTPVNVIAAAAVAVATSAIGPGVTGLAQAALGGAQGKVGYVESVSNSVTIRTASGATVNAKVGDTLPAGTVINTSGNGSAVLKFADGQAIVLAPSSVLGIDRYQFDPSNVKSSLSALDLKTGAMRIVTGTIQTENSAGLSITAGESIVNVLGTEPTDFTVAVGKINGKEIGVARVTLGKIGVATPYGPINQLVSGQSKLWKPEGDSALPPAMMLGLVQGAVMLQQSALPDVDPVAVDASARAAAAAAAASKARAAVNANPANPQLRAIAAAAEQEAAEAVKEATEASQAIAATMFATVLANLPSTAAGPAKAEALQPVTAALQPVNQVLTIPTVTPGAGGGCTGSVC